MNRKLSVGIVTREYPPEVYGGAGVHVENLVRFLRDHVDVKVHCFGRDRTAKEVAASYQPWSALDGKAPHLQVLRTLSVNLSISAHLNEVELVHSHTWYANMAGHFAHLLYGIPHVMTSHSLEPLRPWKAEQLGGGYALSSFCERTAIENANAVVAVSTAMKSDILSAYPLVSAEKVHVIHNGIDPIEVQADPRTNHLLECGIDPDLPYVVFVGRITRQKGIVHLLEAARDFVPNTQLVLCAGEPDTPDLGREVELLVNELRASRGNVVWIARMLTRSELSQVLTHARVFVCPSVYEPFGIVNLEAMACGVPVVAARVGGIPEIVVPGETGMLVPFESDGSPFGTPKNRDAYASDLAHAINELLEDPSLAKRYGEQGRQRVIDVFSWAAIADKTANLYAQLLSR
ncbi:MAG TPA: glycogen synthase [Polyangiaceae bacterium]